MSLYDIKVDAPAQGQFTSNAGQSLSLNFNPAFLVGSGTQTANPSASASASASPVAAPSFASYPAGPGYSTLGQALPGSAVLGGGSLGLPALSSSTMMLLLLGFGGVLLLSGGHK